MNRPVDRWIEGAREKLAAGTLGESDLEELRAAVNGRTHRCQRLLYLHAREPSVTSQVIGWAEHPGEDPGGAEPARPYPTVVAALADGWRCIHFPQQFASFDDRELDMVGYEFILERID